MACCFRCWTESGWGSSLKWGCSRDGLVACRPRDGTMDGFSFHYQNFHICYLGTQAIRNRILHIRWCWEAATTHFSHLQTCSTIEAWPLLLTWKFQFLVLVQGWSYLPLWSCCNKDSRNYLQDQRFSFLARFKFRSWFWPQLLVSLWDGHLQEESLGQRSWGCIRLRACCSSCQVIVFILALVHQ